MKFTLKRPCAHCPFRTDIPGFLRPERMEEIINALHMDQSFPCHETTVPCDDENDEGEMMEGPNTQHCAGAIIFLEKNETANQAMRISERLGFYDRNGLDMDSPVPDCEDEIIEHHDTIAEPGQ